MKMKCKKKTAQLMLDGHIIVSAIKRNLRADYF
jgi:hypothetical protein